MRNEILMNFLEMINNKQSTDDVKSFILKTAKIIDAIQVYEDALNTIKDVTDEDFLYAMFGLYIGQIVTVIELEDKI